MIGMRFASFLSLLILGIIASIVLHLIVRYKMLSGFDGFMNQWIGAWLGSPVLGHFGSKREPRLRHPRTARLLCRGFRGDIEPRAASKAAMAKLQLNPNAPLELKKAS